MTRKQRERENGRGGERGIVCDPPHHAHTPHTHTPRAAVRRSNGTSDEVVVLQRMHLQSAAGRSSKWELAQHGSASRYFTGGVCGWSRIKPLSSRLRRFPAGVSTEDRGFCRFWLCFWEGSIFIGCGHASFRHASH